MKLLKHSIKARILWLLASCVALLLSSPAPGFQTQKTRDENINITRWEYSDTDIGLKRRLEIRGKAEFTDDYTDVKDVSAGGWVLIEDHHDGQVFRYEVRRDPAGQLTRAFFVNSTARPLDERMTVVHASAVASSTRSTRGHQRASARGSATSLHTASGAAGSVRERVTITRRS